MSVQLKILNIIDKIIRSKVGLGLIYNPYWKRDNIYNLNKNLMMKTLDLLNWSNVQDILDLFANYITECNFTATSEKCAPSDLGYFYNNGYFGFIDALIAHCMVRNFRPRHIIEIGSGYSSLVLRRALNLNYPKVPKRGGELICIDPSPRCKIIEHVDKYIPESVQHVDVEIFQLLSKNDILFIDSSHICEPESDVSYIFFNILPKLKPGVLIHIHDITFPKDYPHSYIVNQLRGYNEQYILLAFLLYNKSFEILWGTSYARETMIKQLNSDKTLQEVIPKEVLRKFSGSSFWMQKIDKKNTTE